MFDRSDDDNAENSSADLTGSGGFVPAPGVGGLVSGLVELEDAAGSLALLGKVDFAGLGPDQLLDVVRDVAVLRNRLDGIDVAALAAATRAGAFASSRPLTAAGFLRSECRLSRSEAAKRARVAKRRHCVPGGVEALVAGEITVEHADRLAHTAHQPKYGDAFAEHEPDLIELAKTLSFDRFRKAMARFEYRHDPDQGDDKATHDDAARQLHMSQTFEGRWRIDGWASPIGGEIIHNELSRLEQILFDEDWQEAKTRLGADPLAWDLRRTPKQRRADALVLMAQRSASLGDAPVTSLPCLNVIIDQQTFETMLAEWAGTTEDPVYSPDRTCETEHGAPLSPRQAAQIALTGHIRRIVIDGKGHIIDFGRKKRLFTGALREAIMLRDRTCQHPACTIGARQSQIDHRTPWSRGGPTSETNGQALCRFHNKHKSDQPPRAPTRTDK